MAGSAESTEIDLSGLVVLRVAAGLGLAAYALSLLFRWHPNEDFLDATQRFPYRGLGWVAPLPPLGMRALAVLLGVLGVAMASGYRYRVTAWSATLLYAYFFFVDSVYYDNVGYLALLLVGLLAASPAHFAASLDARARRLAGAPALALRPGETGTALLRFQLGCVFFFAAVAKLYPDWLRGEALRAMCPSYPPVRWLAPLLPPGKVYVAASLLTIAFEVAIVPLLFLRRTRLLAFVAVGLFLLHNALLMPLGAVPWIITGASTVFLPEGWPRWFGLRLPMVPVRAAVAPRPAWSRAAVWGFVLLQLALPMRRWLTAGEPVFHDLGYYFTWALRSRVKEAGGMFRLVDANGKESLSVLVPGAPVRLSSIVSGDPYMLWVSAQRIARRKHVRVYATAMVKLNERQSVPLVDPTVDLAAEAFPLLGVPSWVR